MDVEMGLWSIVAALVTLALLGSGCTVMTGAAADLGEGTCATGALPTADAVASLQSNARLYVDPALAQVAAGRAVDVQLRLENVRDLYGVEMQLAFDPSVVQVVDADPLRDHIQVLAGDVPYPEFVVSNVADNFEGRVEYASVQLAPRPPVSGEGVVTTIRLRGIAPGSSPLCFTGAQLATPDGFGIPVTVEHGGIVVLDATLSPAPFPPDPKVGSPD